MALELVGTLTQVLGEVNGQGKNGPWVKQEFVVETQDTYPRKVCVSAWGNQVNELRKYAVGDVLRVSLNLESREYNGRWYTEARGWRIDLNSGDDAPSGSTEAYQRPAAAPQTMATAAAKLPDAPALANFEEGDDLPF